MPPPISEPCRFPEIPLPPEVALCLLRWHGACPSIWAKKGSVLLAVGEVAVPCCNRASRYSPHSQLSRASKGLETQPAIMNCRKEGGRI